MGQPGRGFIRRLGLASAVSNTGNWAATIALSLVVFSKTHSTIWLSTSFLFTQGLAALLSPLGGLIADRLNRQWVMITCDLLGAGAYAGMALVHEPAELIALGSLAAILHMPFGPTARAAVPNLVDQAELSWANGTPAAAGNVGNLVGPALGGALYAGIGAGAVFWANAGSFVVSAALIGTIHGRFRAERPAPEAHSDGGVWAGVRFLWEQPKLLMLTAIGAITFIASEVATVADLPLIHHFAVGGLGYGVMNTLWGAGGLVGGIVAARVVTEKREPAAAVFGVLVFGAFVAAVGASPIFAIVPVLMFLFAFGDSFAFVGFNGIYQRRSPGRLLVTGPTSTEAGLRQPVAETTLETRLSGRVTFTWLNRVHEPEDVVASDQ